MSAGAGGPLAIFAALARHEVDYLVIGGVAVQAYGHQRTTQDLDIIPAPDARNTVRLAAALKELDARLRGVDAGLLGIDPGDPEHLRDGGSFTLDTSAGQLDLLADAPGAAPYEAMRARAVVVELDGIEIPIAGRDDLIALKRAAGRPIDLDDIAILTDPLQRTGGSGASLERLDVEERPDPVALLLGSEPARARDRRVWEQAAVSLYAYLEQSRVRASFDEPLGPRPAREPGRGAWDALVEQLAEARSRLRLSGPVAGQVGAALDAMTDDAASQ